MVDSVDDIEAVVVELGISSPSSSTPSVTDITLNATSRFRRRPLRARPAALGAAVCDKPWLSQPRTKAQKFSHRLPYFAIAMGFLIVAAFVYDGYTKVDRHKYCLVLDEEFNVLDPSIWSHEQQLDGFGTGSFDWTTSSEDNSRVSDGQLHITPTLQTQIPQTQGQVLNLTQSGTCTGTSALECVAIVNNSVSAIINPVQSARLTTRNSVSIKYGKVEVRAKLPKGQWLWPQIALEPKELAYGQWPASGELDIMSSWGNAKQSDYLPATDKFASSIFYGPDGDYKQAKAAQNYWKLPRGDFSESYHTFGLIWTPTKIYSYVDRALTTVLDYNMADPNHFWKAGDFYEPLYEYPCPDGVCSVNPWLNGTNSAPYDQEFFLSLSLRVGGINGWFPDGGNKPWTNTMNHTAAMTNFLSAQSVWAPTWQQSDFSIESVKMWKQC